MANNPNAKDNLKQFKKGFDPRRNLKGVPKDAVAMRKRMRMIFAEYIGSGETEMLRIDAMLRQLTSSRNPAHNKLALQVLDPKILTESVDVTSGGEKLLPEQMTPSEIAERVAALLKSKNVK